MEKGLNLNLRSDIIERKYRTKVRTKGGFIMKSFSNNLLLILALLITLSMTIFYFSPSILSGGKILNGNFNNDSMTQSNIEIESVVVQNGDTLWNLARRYYGTKTDLRKVIYEIKEINNMNNSDIRPGQQIKIPLE